MLVGALSLCPEEMVNRIEPLGGCYTGAPGIRAAEKGGTAVYVDLYARKSKVLARGDRLREVSTDEQLKQGRAWAHRNGFAVRKEWVELGSAYDEDRTREEFEGAVTAVVSGEVPVLWCYVLDRFSRRGAEDVLRVLGKGRVVFDYDGLDSSDERDRERIIIEAERARAFSRRLSLRVTDVKTSQRDAGEWLGGTPPYGLAVDARTRKLYPDSESAGGLVPFLSRADLMRDALSVLRAGMSARRVVRYLDRLQVPGPRREHWYSAVLLRMVRSSALVGLQVVHVEGTTLLYRDQQGQAVSIGDGLVSAEYQREVIAALSAPTHGGSGGGGRAKHLLTGIIRCAGCGGAMAASGTQYRCNSRVQQWAACTWPANVMRASVEHYVATMWREALTSLSPDDPLAVAVAHRWARLRAPKMTAAVIAAREAVTAATVVRDRLQRGYRAGAYDGAEDMFAEEMRAATASVKAAEAVLVEHEEPMPDASFVDDPEIVDDAWQRADAQLRRDLLRLAIDRVTVSAAPYRGARFDGDTRCGIKWVTHHSL